MQRLLGLFVVVALGGCVAEPPGLTVECPGPLVCLFDPSFVVVTYGTSLTADGSWVTAVSDELEREAGETAMFINTAQSARHSVWGLENFEARVLAHEPDLVFLEFAVNDAYVPYATDLAASRANLETMIDMLEAQNPAIEIVILITNVVIGEGAPVRPELAAYYAEWRAIAMERGLFVVDEEPAWRLLLERSPATFDVLVPDGLHPTFRGHDLMNRPLILDVLRGLPTDVDALVTEVIAEVGL